jgi:hypothetical protein
MLLVAAVLACLLVVRKPARAKPADVAWPQKQWAEHRQQNKNVAEVLGEQVDALVGDPGDKPPYTEIAAAADRREQTARRAINLLGGGVFLLAVVLVTTLVLA